MRWSTHGLITIGGLVIILTQALCTVWIVAVERDVKSGLGALNHDLNFFLMERLGHDSLGGKANASSKSIDPGDGHFPGQ